MEYTPCIVITSIHGSENETLKRISELCRENNYGFIIAGDAATPNYFSLGGCDFLDLATQKILAYSISKLLPDNNYARKNIAYLHAIKKGYRIIIETDDDNIPLSNFKDERNVNIKGSVLKNEGWVNVYRYFSDEDIWPRGFSLNQIKKNVPQISGGSVDTFFCPIQQGLADENPDVDAIYRLTKKLPVYFYARPDIILGKNSVCPFNSQNTTWFKEAFPLLYLPSYCSFRMTDIWRSFIAQRILWTCGWNLSFHNATVLQKRNDHNLIKDMEQEISGYINNEKIVEELCNLELEEGEKNITKNMRLCYQTLVKSKCFDKQELVLLDAWINDIKMLND